MTQQKVPDQTWQNAMNVGNELVKKAGHCTVMRTADFFHVIMCHAVKNISLFIYCYILICLPLIDRLLFHIEESNLLYNHLLHYSIFSKNRSKH